MPRGERWIHPFDYRDPRTSPPRNCRRSTGEPGAQFADQVRSTLGYPGALPNGQNRVKHLIERTRVKRQHVGMAAQVVQGIVDVTGRHGAHPAQILGQDQVGFQRRQGVGSQGVKVGAGSELRADVAVDLAGRHPTGVPAAYDNFLLAAGGRRLVAFEGDADQVVTQAKRVNDLGRRREQRD